jgi:hypothetical protein
MDNTLTLNFIKAENIDSTIAALVKVSPVKFSHEKTRINVMDVISKPEYLNMKAAVKLTFESAEARQEFMKNSKVFSTFQKEATK